MATSKGIGAIAVVVTTAGLLMGCTDDGTPTGSTVEGAGSATTLDSPITTEEVDSPTTTEGTETTSTTIDEADEPGTTTASTAAASGSTAAATARAALDQLEEEDLTTMRNVLEVVGVLDDERLRGGFTVLAPTDEVFRSLPVSELAQIVTDPTSVRPLLERHIIPEVIEPGELGERGELQTLGGQTVTVQAGDPVRVGGAEVMGAGVVDADGRVAVYTVGAFVEAQ